MPRAHDVDLTYALIIGDEYTDLLAAKHLDMRNILVRAGFGVE
jgi:histidinol phosphatase-like enzyme